MATMTVIVGNADDELARLGAHDHRKDGDAGDPRIGFRGAGPAQNVRCRFTTARSVVRLSRTPPTSDLWTMSGDWILTTTALPSAR